MAAFPSSFDAPIAQSASASSSGPADDCFEDACSICLEPFTTYDPAAVTNCKHEYHLQCILEWSQRSKECPICSQFLCLKDPVSQELLAAVESERNLRPSRISITSEDFENEHDAPYTDDSDFNERIMQHLAAAARRARIMSRRERRRFSGFGPSQGLVFSATANAPEVQPTHASHGEGLNSGYGSSEGNSPTSSITSSINNQPPSAVVSSAVNMISSIEVNDREVPLKPRILYSQSPSDGPCRPTPSELVSLSESIKSKLSAASARYKESISKGTRGLKEKLLARNNSVKELSKGVQREMSAGIAGVARMIERLDPMSKRTGVSVPVSSYNVGTSNFSSKGKDVQENVIDQSLNGNDGGIAHDISADRPSYVSANISGRLEVPHTQDEH
ncbi:E3 ubiquitin-protein ligase RHF1A-like isoform X2 [Malania oleifera]|uniref:E3 ubiquitin-protein ligase RHF1A-like isoform X2 n=1 Tax=Malania oleifera TaxID=397392 RepID=UPI0025AE683B|nr:E3 ubiquitin-protein ligase RHF1A-like isoform X2 [Malania oleifera]